MIPKFRAWYTPFGGSVKQFNKMKHGSAGSLLTHAEMSPDDYKIMQSTGLKDKNGVEIFEEDIVKVSNHPFQKKEDSAGIEIDGNYLINWSEHSLTWLAGDLLLYQLKPYIEVIGNVWEDGDLINDSEGAEEN
ncbi:YopX family protein [Enterococcus hailinensis]|uniref:YopX family protein n=1 Tax=Enterococcus hailinensis TaxID=3238988 RepID=UPI0038B2EB00